MRLCFSLGKTYIKAGSGAFLSIGAPLGETERGGLLTGDFERHVREGSGDGASLSVGVLRGEPGGRAPLLGTAIDESRKALEMEHFFL